MVSYSLFVFICLVIHFIINIDIFRKKPTVNLPAIRAYRVFVVSIAAYFLIDLLWGIFEENKLSVLLYIDTTIYFIVMGFTILSWMRYLTKFLETRWWVAKIMLYAGNAFFLAEIVLLIVNACLDRFANHPILFSIDLETCAYTAYLARNIMLYVQIAIYCILLVYTAFFAITIKSSSRRKYFTISVYSAVMSAMIIIQIFHPYLPLYSIGCLVGSVSLNSFVINDIKEEYKTELEQSRELVKQGETKLSETMIIAYTDSLTNVKNKHAYVEEEERIDKLIAQGKMPGFAVVVFDLNGLKYINDTKGHDDGDIYIINACRTIEKYFGHENIYRFGGDEFVAILTDNDYQNVNKTLSEFERFIDSCLDTDLPIISSGMSRYRKEDNTYHAVFYRADKIMYARKEALKEHANN